VIDFVGILRRVCSDRTLQEAFLEDPVRITERLINESYAALTNGLLDLCMETPTGPDGWIPRHGDEHLTVSVSR
jgi:hypothetical protein